MVYSLHCVSVVESRAVLERMAPVLISYMMLIVNFAVNLSKRVYATLVNTKN